MDATPRHHLPFLFPAQAQKEHFHNEALSAIDAALHPAVEGSPRSDPPADPAPGRSWLVAAGATGAWAGREEEIATWTECGWRFARPVRGMLAWNAAAGHHRVRVEDSWADDLPVAGISVGGKKVVGPRAPAVASPSGGTTIDAEARAAIAALIATLKSHGLTD